MVAVDTLLNLEEVDSAAVCDSEDFLEATLLEARLALGTVDCAAKTDSEDCLTRAAEAVETFREENAVATVEALLNGNPSAE